MKQQKQAIVNVTNLGVQFGEGIRSVRAVDDVSFSIRRGEFSAFVGESGCGKSMTAYAVTRLLPRGARLHSDSLLIDGEETRDWPEGAMRSIRGSKVAFIFQEPGSSLNPVMRVGAQIAEAVRLHRRGVHAADEAIRLMEDVGIPGASEKARAYAHQLSGGMQQRVMIAMALASRPDLLIADEPTTALDVTVQAQIMDLLRELNRKMGMAVWLITHNLALVTDVAEWVYVMYAGRIVEKGPAVEVLRHPRHPYTVRLLRSLPVLDGESNRLEGIAGSVPGPGEYVSGCLFAPRCDLATPQCWQKTPELQCCDATQHWTACPVPAAGR